MLEAIEYVWLEMNFIVGSEWKARLWQEIDLDIFIHATVRALLNRNNATDQLF